MGFWNVNLEAAQAQASQAGPWAKRWLQTMTESTMHLAEQASSKLPPALHTPYDADTPPTPAELTQYGITPEFKEFVRSLTYSTFRDFHGDEGASSSEAASASASAPVSTCSDTASAAAGPIAGAGAPSTSQPGPLTPWQEKHALLVVRSVQEINELRFVLVPKRMSDQDFWRIYFALARKYLPAQACQPAVAREGPRDMKPASGLATFDIQDRLQQLSVSAKQWGAQASASLQAATASGHRQSLIPEALWQKLSPSVPAHGVNGAQLAAADLADLAHRPASSTTSPSLLQPALPVSTGPHAPQNELAEDPDLEAYLRDVGEDGGTDSPRATAAPTAPDAHLGTLSDGEDDDIDEDFEKYISEINGEQDDEAEGDSVVEGKGTSGEK